MAITNLYPNLPGHLVEFKDGGLQLTSSDTTTANGKSLLILGTAFDGPVNEPVKVDKTTVSQLFGSDVNEKGFPNGATITKYAKQAFSNGFSDVRCMRVTGSCAYTDIVKTVKIDEADIPMTAKGTILGNDAHDNLQLEHLPVCGDDVTVSVISGGTSAVVMVDDFMGPYDYQGKFSIRAGMVSKNATLKVNYNYIVIDTTPKTKTHTINADGRMIALDFDPATQGIYITITDSGSPVEGADSYPITNGVTITDSDGVSYATGFTVLGNTLEILDDGTIPDDKELTIEYYVYTKTPAEQSISLNDGDQKVELDQEPIDGSIAVTVGGKTIPDTAEYYEVSDKTVTLKAGKFRLNDSYVIEYKYKDITSSTEAMRIQAIYGGSAYKSASVNITSIADGEGNDGRSFVFTKPESKLYSAEEKPLSFTSFDYPTIGALKIALESSPLNNVFEIISDNDDILTGDFPIFSGTLENGGDDGVNVSADDMYKALSGERDKRGYLINRGAYQILENYHCDYIYPAGVYADMKQNVNRYSGFQHELALLCAMLTYRTNTTHGFIDVKPNSNTTLIGIQKHVDKLLGYNNLHYMIDNDGNELVDSEGKKMDIGWYTSLVVGPEPVMFSDTLGTYYGSPAIAYAALCASLNPWSAPTNKALPNVRGMKYRFSNKQQNALVGNRMIVFKIKNEGSTTATSTPYCVDAMTSGAPKCDYARMSTVSIVTDVVNQIREVADPFIGEPNTIEQRNALSALISKRLTYLMEKGEILHYVFEINATIQQVLIGECTLDLELVCPMELRVIKTRVGLKAAA